jgi:putative ABC transport system permease protein
MLSRFRSLAATLTALFSRRIESELEQELQFHVEELTADNLRAGMEPQEARRQALIAIGGIEKTREDYRDALGTRLLHDLVRDLSLAFRQLRRAPGFTAVVVLSLALGIGANTTVFSVVEAVLLRPLPFPDQDRLVCLYGFALTTANVEQWGEASHDYERFAAVAPEVAVWTGGDEPQRLHTASVSKGFFSLLGLEPVVGRWFGPGDFRPDSEATVIVGEQFWRNWFGSTREIVGRKVVLDGTVRTVVGVMPARTPLPFAEPDFWLPQVSSARAHGTYAVARLKRGADVESARMEALTLAARLAPAGRVPKGRVPVQVLPLIDMLVGDARSMLLALAAAVAFVYLIVCTNVANLILARATTRSKEISIRLALGAGHLRLFRQLSTESLLLAALGTAGGLVASGWLLQAMKLLLPYAVPRIGQAHLDLPVFALAVSLAAVAALVFGVAPLVAPGSRSLHDTLTETTRAITDTRRRRALRGTLVVAEVSLALVLLVGAGLLIKTFLRLRPSDPGFNPRDKLVLQVTLPSNRYPDDSDKLQFVDAAMDRLRALPGVRAVGVASDLPFTGMAWPADIVIDGQKVAGTDVGRLALGRIITPGFLRLLETPLAAGRGFDARDGASGPGAAIVNQAFVRSFLEGDEDSALGRRMAVDTGGGTDKEFTIVGVARDARIFANSSSARPEFYLPLAQASSARLSFVLSVSNPMKKASMARQALRGDDKELVITNVQTLQDILYDSVSYERFHALLLGVLAALAVLLASIGTYGVLSYSAGLRVREMGIRLALGARRTQVVWLVLRQGLLLAGLGIALGTVGAWAMTRYLASLLIEVRPTDAPTFAAAAMAWMFVAALACLVPAARAARIDPALTLRTE